MIAIHVNTHKLAPTLIPVIVANDKAVMYDKIEHQHNSAVIPITREHFVRNELLNLKMNENNWVKNQFYF